MARGRHLQHIRTLDPARDHCEIVFIDASYEFPFDIARALEFALFRTYAVPRISALLRKTGELTERPRKRYDDTDLILSELVEHGYDSERGRAALANMNRQHARYPIRNEDYLYVLSTFVFEPIRWIDRFAYRGMVEQERLAWFLFWRAVGERMHIRDLPDSYADFERYNIEYERERFRYAEANQVVAEKTRDLFLGFYLPRALFALGRPVIYAMLDRPLLSAFGFAPQTDFMQRSVRGLLRLRGRFAGWLPARRRPVLRTQLRRPTYPRGYDIEALGPASDDSSSDDATQARHP
ncbi:MAG: oxygenase MpaB family protein [Gammaproteobacteria bacterium]|jgi:hypothetical protein